MHYRNTTPVYMLCCLAALTVFTSSAMSAEKAPTSPDDLFFNMDELSAGVALSGRQFYIPTVLGPTGMNGWIHGETLVVREVETDSPADGIAITNDIIGAANGKPLGPEPLKTLGEQIEVSEQSGKLKLQITRAGQSMEITIPLRKLGGFGKDWPYDCAKSRAIHIDACNYLVRQQNREGLFDGKIYVGFALNGLTWLATEDPKYWEHARRLAYGYRKDFNPEATSTVNWEWGYMGVFLAEYYLQTGDATVLPLCEALAQSLVQSQQPCGTWGHGVYPGAGYVQGGSLNNCGLVCWMALVLLDEAGVRVDQQALAKATDFFTRFNHRGGVPYGDHRPEFGGGNGKNAIPGVVFNILGDTAASEYYARLVTGSYRGRTGGHTGGYMGFIWGNVQGAQNPHWPDYRRMIEHWQWLLNVSRRWDGGFLLPESVIGKIYTYRGPILSTGGVAQMFAMPSQSLRIHGGPKSVFARQELPSDITQGLLHFRHCRFDELRETVKADTDWGRQLLTAADRKEKDLELSFAKLEACIESRDFTLAQRIWNDLDRLTIGEHPKRGSYNWRLSTTEGIGDVSTARKIYERHRWLTYTSREAREAFERLAADPKTGIYQQLARLELATPDDATLWAYYCELLWKGKAVDWQIDPQARATALRVAAMPSGHWPRISALNDLYAAGLLTEQLKGWTPLVAACTEGYPGERLTWKMLSVKRDEKPPAGWTMLNFDDSDWSTGSGPLVSDRDATGMRTEPNSTPFIRIAFDCDSPDFEAMVLVLRLLRSTKAVVYLNGEPILWSDALQGPRMRIVALAAIPLEQQAIKLLRKGRNILAVRVSGGNGADFGLYGSKGGTLAFVPRPKDWSPGPVLAKPNLSIKTAARPKLATVLAPCTTGLTVDPPGQPNVGLGDMIEDVFGHMDKIPTKEVSIVERARYLGHVDSRIRRMAAYSLMREGEAALPTIIEALESDDTRVIRAGCDAIGGSFGMNGLGKGNYRKIMTPEIAGRAVPYLLPLLEHEDMYVREGALMALSNCGEATAAHLDKIVELADDDDWWVRAGVAYVLRYVIDPATGEHADSTIANFLTEQSIFGKNRFRNALTEMAKRGHASTDIVEALMIEAKEEGGGAAVTALSEIGPRAKVAIPIFEQRRADAQARADNAKNDDEKKRYQRYADNWQRVIDRTNGPD